MSLISQRPSRSARKLRVESRASPALTTLLRSEMEMGMGMVMGMVMVDGDGEVMVW